MLFTASELLERAKSRMTKQEIAIEDAKTEVAVCKFALGYAKELAEEFGDNGSVEKNRESLVQAEANLKRVRDEKS
jgi:hypothetical protein